MRTELTRLDYSQFYRVLYKSATSIQIKIQILEHLVKKDRRLSNSRHVLKEMSQELAKLKFYQILISLCKADVFWCISLGLSSDSLGRPKVQFDCLLEVGIFLAKAVARQTHGRARAGRCPCEGEFRAVIFGLANLALDSFLDLIFKGSFICMFMGI